MSAALGIAAILVLLYFAYAGGTTKIGADATAIDHSDEPYPADLAAADPDSASHASAFHPG